MKWRVRYAYWAAGGRLLRTHMDVEASSEAGAIATAKARSAARDLEAGRCASADFGSARAEVVK